MYLSTHFVVESKRMIVWFNHLEWPVTEGRGTECQAPEYSLLPKFYPNHLVRLSSAASPLSWSSA